MAACTRNLGWGVVNICTAQVYSDGYHNWNAVKKTNGNAQDSSLLRLASQKEGMFGRCPNFGKWLCTARTPMPPGCDVYCVGDSGYSHYSTLTGSDATFVSAQSRTNPAKHLATTMV